MANTIRIQRSVTTNTPVSLAQGELANSESATPNGINELFIGINGASILKLLQNINAQPAQPTAGLSTATLTNADWLVFDDAGTPARALVSGIDLASFSNSAGWEANQTITTGTGLDGADAGSSTDFTIDLDFTELTDMTLDIAATTEFILNDAGTNSRKAASEIKLSAFSNDSGWEANDPNTVLTTDTDVTGWSFVLDEDLMGSDSATKLATQQSIKAYVDSVVASGVVYKGAFDPTAGAGAGSPDLDTITSGKGDMYTVTVAGTYNWTTGSAVLEIGDVLIAEADGVLNDVADWTIVQTNIGAASETAAGYIEIATQTEMNTATDDLRAVTPLKYANSTIDGGTF